MKTTKKNNPVVVGALLGILAVVFFLLMKQMGGGDAPATLTPVADTHADDAPKTTAAIASQGQQRDPFDHPALHRITKDGMPAQSLTPEAQAAQEAARMTPPGSKVPGPPASGPKISALPILPDRTQAHAALPVGTAPGATVPTGPRPAGSGAHVSVQEADDPLKGWHLTATIGGQHPRAVIEGAGIGIYRVGVGERVRALQVVAIHEREIVLSDAHHLYTLSLMSAPSALEDSKDDKDNKDNKDASVDTITTTARENENGTAKIHP
jgi:hypothetical protein